MSSSIGAVLEQLPNGITFTVDEVKPCLDPCPTHKTKPAIEALVGTPVEACSDYTSDCLTNVSSNPLASAVWRAYGEHRPLILSPDMIWITIVQSVAEHVHQHAERLRDRFVDFGGKRELTVFTQEVHKGSPENRWNLIVAQFSDQIAEHIGDVKRSLFECSFSTTGPVERTAGQIALMDLVEEYFDYMVMGICGIPKITLEGTVADWEEIERRVDQLDEFELDWWLKHLRPICAQFTQTRRGNIDHEHWRQICKIPEQYGRTLINGWIAKLFPFLKTVRDASGFVRNPILSGESEAVELSSFPKGISRAPFIFSNQYGKHFMQLLGGFVGITQASDTAALRPKLGWAVRDAQEADELIYTIAECDTQEPDYEAEYKRRRESPDEPIDWPTDLLRIYHHFGEVVFFENDRGVCRLRPQHLVTREKRGPWSCDAFCDLPDGGTLAFVWNKSHQQRIVLGDSQQSEIVHIVAINVIDVIQALLDAREIQDVSINTFDIYGPWIQHGRDSFFSFCMETLTDYFYTGSRRAREQLKLSENQANDLARLAATMFDESVAAQRAMLHAKSRNPFAGEFLSRYETAISKILDKSQIKTWKELVTEI